MNGFTIQQNINGVLRAEQHGSNGIIPRWTMLSQYPQEIAKAILNEQCYRNVAEMLAPKLVPEIVAAMPGPAIFNGKWISDWLQQNGWSYENRETMRPVAAAVSDVQSAHNKLQTADKTPLIDDTISLLDQVRINLEVHTAITLTNGVDLNDTTG